MIAIQLDCELVSRGLIEDQERAIQLIHNNCVRVNGRIIRKPDYQVCEQDSLSIVAATPFVSRGGLQLESALKYFQISVKGKTILDVGAGAGGFTDCALHYGAKKIYAIDTEINLIAPQLKNDPRAHILEGADIRDLKSLPESADLGFVDVAPISLRLVLPYMPPFLKPNNSQIIALIKPQCETANSRHPQPRQQIVENLLQWIQSQGWSVIDGRPSPIAEEKGNREYFVLVDPYQPPTKDIDEVMDKLSLAAIPNY
ncbi:MAG: TlyA family RNA methyltransferase [Parcubacteria group bacterium]|nr:TlyA family RNA methyltransferase [Parcubacteria group bacterium]